MPKHKIITAWGTYAWKDYGVQKIQGYPSPGPRFYAGFCVERPSPYGWRCALRPGEWHYTEEQAQSYVLAQCLRYLDEAKKNAARKAKELKDAEAEVVKYEDMYRELQASGHQGGQGAQEEA